MADKAQTPQLKELPPEDPEALVALARPAANRSESLTRTTNVLGWMLAALTVWLSFELASRVFGHVGSKVEPVKVEAPRVQLKGLDELYRSIEQEKKNPLYTEGVDKLKGQLSKTETQLEEMINKAKPKAAQGKRKVFGSEPGEMERF